MSIVVSASDGSDGGGGRPISLPLCGELEVRGCERRGGHDESPADIVAFYSLVCTPSVPSCGKTGGPEIGGFPCDEPQLTTPRYTDGIRSLRYVVFRSVATEGSRSVAKTRIIDPAGDGRGGEGELPALLTWSYI